MFMAHFSQKLTGELKEFTKIHPSKRPWHLPFTFAIAISMPVAIGVYYDALAAGLLASLGAMVILNLPLQGGFMYRMVAMLTCSFGFVSCFAVGLLAHTLPSLTPILLFFITFWVTLFSRYYQLAPPAGVFILMSTSIALFMPLSLFQLPHYTGLMALGCLFAGIVGCVYTLIMLYKKPLPTNPSYRYEQDLLSDSLLMAIFVALSLGVALWLGMPRPYWVLMSCYIVMQGMNFRSIWLKQGHRIMGTAVGLLLAWAILAVVSEPWMVAVAIFILMFMIESLVVRHYGIAVVFITPLTIMMAEFSQPHALSHASTAINMVDTDTILTRFWDTLLGCLIGLIGGLIVHSKELRPKLQGCEQWFFNKVVKDFYKS